MKQRSEYAVIWELQGPKPYAESLEFFPLKPVAVSKLKKISIVECVNPFWRVSAHFLDSRKLVELDR